ncbi:MAG: hypothetical protein LBJ08_01510 [Bifidobacteriaceae bacterium]|jgi:hypothetical protein|nr:hypothetical protein [Bifidobacteriaceae bacterium]
MTMPIPEPFDPDDPVPDLDTTDNASPAEDVMVPIVWRELNEQDYSYYMLKLNAWVRDLVEVWGIPATTIPPWWHRHELLIELLTGLWCHWLQAHDEEQNLSAKFLWQRDLEEWKGRMREAVATLGCRLDWCRSPRPVLWPGDQPKEDPNPPVNLGDREEDLVACLLAEENRRRVQREEQMDIAMRGQPSTIPDPEEWTNE